MKSLEELEFVNRKDEMQFLKANIIESSDSSFIIIRSPSGYGKSRLTSNFCQFAKKDGYICCIIDPDIQENVENIKLHSGFFIQKCAEQLSFLAESSTTIWNSIKYFAKRRRKKALKELNWGKLFEEMPSFESLYKKVVALFCWFFGKGKYNPQLLLTSDDPKAIIFCSEYIEDVLRNNIILIIREAQHIDIYSLNYFIRIYSLLKNNIIIEYTSETENFHYLHEKHIIKYLTPQKNVYIYDLVRFSYDHLKYLLLNSKYTTVPLTVDIYNKWNGNLRSVAEMRFKVGIVRTINNEADFSNCFLNLNEEIVNHFSSLTAMQKIIITICIVHIESINKYILIDILYKFFQHSSMSEIENEINSLVRHHKFLSEFCCYYKIDNETIVDGVRLAPGWISLEKIAETKLRDFYYEITYSKNNFIGIGQALRQLFRLCVKTQDISGLLEIIDRLSSEIQISHDQAMFVGLIVEAVTSEQNFYIQYYTPLILWAAELAYSIGNWAISEKLFSILNKPDSVSKIFYACAMQEIGKHDEALNLAANIINTAKTVNERLAAELIVVLVHGCRGNHKMVRSKLLSIINDDSFADSYLLGYAYRFFEITDNCFNYIKSLEKSIIYFEKFGLLKSKAYSQAALAVVVARKGNSKYAYQLIHSALAQLKNEIHDKHLLLNNQAVIELLSEEPDFALCTKILSEAIRYTGDDFSEAVILSNLSLAYWKSGDIQIAQNCTEKVLRIVAAPDFADRDIFWGLCFNSSLIYDALGMEERSAEVKQIPFKSGRSEVSNFDYWSYRYGNSTTPPELYTHLVKFPYHPLYLSHWLLEMDGLNLLKKELQQ